MKNRAGKNDRSVEFLHGTKLGKLILEFILFVRIPKLLGFFLRTPLSALYIKPFIKKSEIDMTGFEGKKFRSFNDFFTRKKEKIDFDENPSHLISPSDSLLSAYKITDDAKFRIKGFEYTIQDFFMAEALAHGDADIDSLIKSYSGGDCLVFRLCATDYHRYCYIDDGKHAGFLGENHFLEGKLYSVQPSAAENFRIYTKNRRSWTVLETVRFGRVAQVEVGAFSVGGIVNHLPREGKNEFSRGDEKGYFDLHGSTIVLLFEKGKIQLLPEILECVGRDEEFRVKCGQFIGTAL